MKSIPIRNGIIRIAESKAICPHCETHISFDEIEPRWMKSKKGYFRMKCKCKRLIGITMNIIGDFVAYDLYNR